VKSFLIVLALVAPSAGCSAAANSSPSPPAGEDSGGAADTGPLPDAENNADGDGGTKAPSADADASPTETSTASEAGPPTLTTVAMPRISAGVPAFASGNIGMPANANDGDPATSWVSDKLPAWIAYDLSRAPGAQRQNVMVVWNALHAPDYLHTSPPAGAQMPTDYTIEINGAPGGTSAAPTSGWVQVAAIHGNLVNSIEHTVALSGSNWVRMSITGSTDSNVAVDLDVFSAPNGCSDCWMFMGDSITFMTMVYAFSDLPLLVHQATAARWPVVIDAAIGGTNTMTATSVINSTLSGFPGRFVVLAYGTNDIPNMFQMEGLVQSVIAVGKIPVVPHMPWSALSNIQSSGPQINQAIDALYAKYPQIVHGPDLWTAFMNRTDLIPANDVHPNSAGQAFLRQQWAQVISAIP
jgi:hypothetical protein